MKTINKIDHIEVGLRIKIILARCDRVHTYNSHNLFPGSIHTIVDQPSRRSYRNGEGGVWVEGTEDQVFVRFYEWVPYIVKQKMIRTKMTRTKNPEFIRTR